MKKMLIEINKILISKHKNNNKIMIDEIFFNLI